MFPDSGHGCLDENTVTALVEHGLTDEERGDAEAHLDTCPACRRLVSALVATGAGTHAPLGRGTSVGRYILVDVLGAGAMGVVYAAFDPALDRKVALKVLQSTSAQSASLELEARAMARLNHPHVVQVYDAGSWGDRFFLVMEFVAGRSLTVYLREHPTSGRAIVALFVQAGRGLWAAHQEGVIHRDLKPDNILIDAAGQARVGDFGLARVGSVHAADGGAAEATGVATSLAGTPAYMAPEQLRGEVATSRSDQFSFCVALHEALLGTRPFGGDGPEPLLAAIGRGWHEPARTALPGHVRRVLRRGLQLDPAARYPTMLALVEELGQVRARRGAAVAVVVGAVASVALLLGGRRAYQERSCQQAAAEVTRVWNSSLSDRITRAFAASNAPLAEEAARGTIVALDRHARAWSQARGQLCRGEALATVTPSPAAAETREQCLRDRLDEMGALVGQLERAEPRTVGLATSVSHELTPASRCMEAEALLVPPREPPALRARADEVRRSLAEARVLYRLGELRAALEVARRALPQAQALGHLPLKAEALLRLGHLEVYTGEPGSEAHLIAAVQVAEEAHADRTKAEAADMLAYLVGYEKRRHQQGLDWSDFALATVARLGGDDVLTARILLDRSSVLRGQNRTEEAADCIERALVLAARAGIGKRFEASALVNLATMRSDQRRYAEATTAYQRALELLPEAYGPKFPTIALALQGLASILVEQGDYAAARRHFARMNAQFLLAYSPEHRSVLLARAEELEFETLAGRAATILPDARALEATALRVFGPAHEVTTATQLTLGRVLLEAGHPGEALALLAPLSTAAEGRLDRGDVFLIVPFFLLGTAELSLGHRDAARAHLDRALALGDAGTLHLSDRAALRFAAARAQADRDPGRACALAREALDLHRGLVASPEQARAAAIADWLAARGECAQGR